MSECARAQEMVVSLVCFPDKPNMKFVFCIRDQLNLNVILFDSFLGSGINYTRNWRLQSAVRLLEVDIFGENRVCYAMPPTRKGVPGRAA